MSNIYTVTCVFRVQGMSLQLQYLSRETAEMVYLQLMTEKGDIGVGDDFGSKAMVRTPDLMSVVFTDLARSFDGQREIQLLTARANAKTQSEVNRDPMLKVATGNGSIISPNH